MLAAGTALLFCRCGTAARGPDGAGRSAGAAGTLRLGAGAGLRARHSYALFCTKTVWRAAWLGAGASYALFFGVLALLAALVVPQLVQSITAFAGRLAAYEKTIRQLLLWVQATFGIDMATAEQLVQTVGSELQGWFASLSRQAAQAAARAAGMLQTPP